MVDLYNIDRALSILLVISFSATFAASIYQLVQNHFKGARSVGWSLTKTINLLLPWGLLARAIDMLINWNSDYLSSDMSKNSTVSILLGSIPGYLFFSTFLVLSLFWVLLYHRSYDKDTFFVRKIHIVYLVINGLVYTVWLTLLLLMLCVPDATFMRVVHSMLITWAVTVSFAVSVSFLVYAIRVHLSLRQLNIANNDRLQYATKIGFLMLLFTVVFALRGLFIFLVLYVFHGPIASLVSKLIFQVLLELIPIIVALFVLGARPKTNFDEYTSLLNAVNRTRITRQNEATSPLVKPEFG